MDIRIDKYLLASDSLNITLSERLVRRSGTNEGEEYWDTIGYYSSVETALNGLVNREVKKSDATTLKELIQHIDSIRQTIADALNEAGLPR